MSESARPYSPTALPPVAARALAFVAILVGGLCGGLIGWSVTDLQCGPPHDKGVATAHRDCATWDGVGAVVGAGVGAGGTGVVSVLVLRAMAEWRKDLDVEEPPA
jgi:hypothetical protein